MLTDQMFGLEGPNTRFEKSLQQYSVAEIFVVIIIQGIEIFLTGIVIILVVYLSFYPVVHLRAHI